MKKKLKPLWQKTGILIIITFIVAVIRVFTVGKTIETYPEFFISLASLICNLLTIIFLMRCFMYLIERQIEKEESDGDTEI